MINPILEKRFQGHYGLEYLLTKDEVTIQEMIGFLAKQNRVAKQDKKIRITPTWRKILKKELDERMRIRRRKEKERRYHIYK